MQREGAHGNIGENFHTVLCRACHYGRIDVVEKLLGEKHKVQSCDLDMYSYDGDTPLIAAARQGHADICHLLLRNRASVNKPHQCTGETALAVAIDNRHHDVMDILLDCGANVLTCDNVKCTPLYIAIRMKDTLAVSKLLCHGSNPNAGSQDHTPMFLAARLGLLDVAKLLDEAGCTRDTAVAHGVTPLHEACLKGHVDVVRYLISTGRSVNRQDKDLRSPLFSAVDKGNLEICKLLAEAGASPLTMDQTCETPLDVALRKGDAAIVEVLLEHGAEISSRHTSSILKVVESLHVDVMVVLFKWCSNLDLCSTGADAPVSMHSLKQLFRKENKLLHMLLLSGIRGGLGILEALLPELNSITSSCSPHHTFLIHYLNSPRRLQEICRTVVRHCFSNKVVSKTELLPLPRYIKDYIELKVL